MRHKMLHNKSHLRFLLRGSAAIFLLLGVWWLALLNPLLLVTRGSAGLLGHLLLGGDAPAIDSGGVEGGWKVNVPVEFSAPASNGSGAFELFHSLDFELERADLLIFTFSLPAFWALMLAPPWRRDLFRPLLLGSLLMAAVSAVLALAFVEIYARTLAEQLAHTQGDVAKWLLRFAYYLVANVVPYAAPLLAAVALHSGLKRIVFGGGSAEPAAVGAPVASGASGQKTKKHRKVEASRGSQ
jgi:hypothetical protein